MKRYSNKPKSTRRSGAFAGGSVGLVLFIIFGLLPSLLYGGYAGVALAGGIFGMPIHVNVLAQAVAIFTTLVSVLGTAAVFVLLGATVGMTLASAVLVVNRPSGHGSSEVEQTTR